MKNFILGFALLFLLLTAATAFTNDPTGRNINIGSELPKIEIKNAKTTVNIGAGNKNYILLTFWASTDARSRQDCYRYNNLFTTNPALSDVVEHVAVNLDENPVLFRSVAKADGLDMDRQFRTDHTNAAELRAVFELDTDLNSVLISPDGTVMAINPSVDFLLNI